MNLNKLLKHKYFKFCVALTLYLLFVIWLTNYWFLLGIPIVFDVYVSKKVNWSFWKSRKKKNSVLIEWLDALIFAVVAVSLINIFLFQNYKIPTPSMEGSLLVGDHLYVSKTAYGPGPPTLPWPSHSCPIPSWVENPTWSGLSCRTNALKDSAISAGMTLLSSTSRLRIP